MKYTIFINNLEFWVGLEDDNKLYDPNSNELLRDWIEASYMNKQIVFNPNKI